MSAWSRALSVSLSALAVAGASACSDGSENSSLPASDSPALAPTRPAAIVADVCPSFPAFCTDTASMERALVVVIVDGDTFDVTIDGRRERVRTFGIDTAERGDECFTESSDRLRALAGAEVRLMPDARERDRNARLLRYVYTPTGTSIDAVMVAEGLARAWTRDGALRDPLVALETQARVNLRGCLWSE